VTVFLFSFCSSEITATNLSFFLIMLVANILNAFFYGNT
jgi:hypothetical protein